MSRLEGSWKFTLLRPPGDCEVPEALPANDPRWPLTQVTYRFCMWPKGEQSGLCVYCVVCIIHKLR